LSPIDAVQRYGDAADAKAAAVWLCQVLGIEPSSLGWNGKTTNAASEPEKDPSTPARPDPNGEPSHWHVDPWPEQVSGAKLLDGMCEVFQRFMVLREHTAEAISLWVLHAWTINAFEISPLMIVVSPTKQCGKSTLMTLLLWITPRSELVSNATASPIFRSIEDSRPDVPTFLLDEGDSFIKPDREDLRGILNSGWMRAGATVLRTESDGNIKKARRFSTWAPKVIATIKAVADTLMDRAVIIPLIRKAKSDKVERFRMRDTPEFAALRQQARRWANDNVEALRDADPDVPSALHNRAADNWRALIAIADAAGGDWPERARAAAIALSGAKGDDDKGVMLLRDIHRVFEEGRHDWLGAETLVERLVELPETPWAEWRRGEKPITTRGVATILRDFEIKSDDDHRPRRYWRADFAAAWAAYLATDDGPSGTSG
jgi:putative DNA primase/helicase